MLSLGTSEKSPKGRDAANICTELAPSAFSRAAPFLKEGFLPLIFFLSRVKPGLCATAPYALPAEPGDPPARWVPPD